MRFLFIHQNFPAQFRHIAEHLNKNSEHDVMALCQAQAPSLVGINTIRYQPARTAKLETHHYIRPTETHILNGQAVAQALLQLKQSGYIPDIVIAHTGWGEALYVKDVFPNCKLIGFFEFYYQAMVLIQILIRNFLKL